MAKSDLGAPKSKDAKINGHVTKLNRFLPFSASHDQIYEEYQTGEDGLTLETKALAFTIKAVITEARCIVLTGDAGHGKTHLCRRLLEKHLGYESQASRQILLERCDGRHDIDHAINSGSVRKLRIHKDFSEIDPDAGAKFIEEYGNKSDVTLVICANEGRLRAVINSPSSGSICQQLLKTFQQSFLTGLASTDGLVHIVNLNFQSVSAQNLGQKESLLRRTLQDWAGNGTRWAKSCGVCCLAERCPIKRNRDLLGAEEQDSKNRIEKLERLYSTVERLGHVITIREMLMLTAYIITGGLVCQDIKRLAGSADCGWQHSYAYYNLLFVRPASVSEDRLFKGIPILSIFARFDPGNIAMRSVDDRLLNIGGVFESGQLDLQFEVQVGNRTKTIDASSGIDEIIGSPQSRTDLSREADSVRKIVAALRRRAFFDDRNTEADMLKRLGFRHGDDFLSLLEEKLTPQGRVRLKNLIVAGLHGIQGLRMSSTETTLFLVDPAFGRATADAAIIARRIPTKDIQIVSSGAAWNLREKTWTLPESVDWIDRSVVVRIDDRNSSSTTELALDLLAFECAARSASGYISEGFYAQEIRRIRTFLGKLAEVGRSTDGQITLFLKGLVHTVSLDEGVIQVGGGGN